MKKQIKTENNKMNEGINILLTELNLHKIVKIVLACGDEVIFPFIEKLNKYSINFDKIIFCTLPFGRSNDLSVQFGFGKSISDISNNSLKKILNDIIESTSVLIDIWEIKLTFDDSNGGYININNNFQKYQNITTTMRRGFISYFSLGYDSRIGFNLSKEKYNQSKLREDHGQKITIFQTNVIDLNIHQNDNISINNSKSDNRIVPTNEVINKNTFKKAHNITNEGEEENEIEESDSESEYEKVNSVVKTFKYEKVMIKGEPLGLICQNIKYFCDGNESKWDSKKPKYGIQIRKKMSIDNKSNNELKKVRNYIYYIILILNILSKIGTNKER